MQAVGQVGRLGRLLASSAGFNLTKATLAILAKYGAAANLYLPGVGTISGIAAGNWLDSAGTTAATVDNPVGLVVSAGKAVGPELVTNGDFSNETTGWVSGSGSAIIANVAGALQITNTATNGWATNQTAYPVYAGSKYLWTLTNRGATPVSYYIRDGVGANADMVGLTINAGEVKSGVFTSNTTGLNVRVFCIGTATAVASVDNISIRELPGTHLTQSTAANRPILRLSGGVYAWDFVSSDSFTTTLGTGNAGFFCTMANVADAGVNRTILCNGAIGANVAGVWLLRTNTGALQISVGNGTSRNTIGAAYPTATNAIASAGWDSGALFVGVGNAETSATKMVDCTLSTGLVVGAVAPSTLPWLGTIGATIIMPTVLPTASERATLRQFIASVSA